MKSESRSRNGKIGEWHFFFSAALAILCIPIFSIVFFNAFMSGKWNGNARFSQKADSAELIGIFTDKTAYLPGETISLSLENQGKKYVYLEPCKFMNVFEKKIGEQWVLEDEEERDLDYFKDGFERQQGNARCDDITLPKTGSGTYRMIAMVFYGCKTPNRYSCERSERLYSNEFQVAAKSPVQLP